MKNLLLLLIFLIYTTLYSQNRYDPENYYNITNLYLKPINLENELIFYGHTGGVLRSYENRTKWKQNYSGTHSEIYKMIYSNGRLIGVTANGNIMTSDDKGDWWKYIKLSSTLTGLTKFENILIASSSSDSLFYSYDNGLTWTLKIVSLKDIVYVDAYNHQLLATTKSGKLYKSDDIGNKWEEFEAPFKFRLVKCTNDSFIIASNFQVAILKDDFTWKTVNLISNGKYLSFVTTGDSLIVFSAYHQSVPKLDICYYNLSTAESKLITSYENPDLGYSYFQYTPLCPVDVIYMDNTYYFSGYYKTILKSKDLINWEVVSHVSNIPFIEGIINDTLKLKNSPVSYTGLTDFYSVNKGATFIPTKNYLTSFGNRKFVNLGTYKCNISKDEVFYTFYNQLSSTDFDTSIVTQKIFAKSYDGGNTKIILDIGERIFNIENPYGALYKSKFLGFNNGKCYSEFTYGVWRKGPTKDGYTSDSTYKHIFFSIDMKTEKIDTLAKMNLDIMLPNLFFDNDKIWMYGTVYIKPSDYPIGSSLLYLSKDGGKTFKMVMYYPSIMNFFNKSKEGDYFFTSNKYVCKLDTSNFTYKEFEYGFDEISLDGVDVIRDNYFFDQYFILYNKLEDGSYDKFIAKLSFNDSLKVNVIDKIDPNIVFAHSSDDDFTYFYRSLGVIYSINFPIEKERLDYYSSVDKTEQKNYLYTYPAFPQPSRNEIKIKTYWDSSVPFNLSDVSFYNINGIEVKPENLRLIKENIYSGYIIFDASNLQKGIYFVKINHGTESRVSKVLVE